MSIVVNAGPMYASKTSLMLFIAAKLEREGKKYLVICHPWVAKDAVTTHDNKKIACQNDIPDDYLKYSHILIDEVQFFENAWKICNQLRAAGIHVICFGLDMNFKGEPFLEMGLLMAVSDEVNKMRGTCAKCHTAPSTMSERLNKGNKELVDIGAEDKYIPTCRSCHRV